MSIPVVAFFNNKGGVGKTSLVYHLSWILADLGYSVLAADLDPQANLSAAFIDEDSLADLWQEGPEACTIYQAIRPLLEGIGDLVDCTPQWLDEGLHLVAGDLALSRFEDQLTDAWPRCLAGDARSFRVTSAFWRVLQRAAACSESEVILLDLGPNLGALNRAALVASDSVVVPLAPDLFSLRGLENLGPALRDWRAGWQQRLERAPPKGPDLSLPSGAMQPAGYVVQQHAVRLDRPVKAYERWVGRIPSTYRTAVLGETAPGPDSFSADPNCLALVRNYRSLVPMSQEARKPIFHLRAADGALGGHMSAVLDARACFEQLARKIAERTFLLGRQAVTA